MDEILVAAHADMKPVCGKDVEVASEDNTAERDQYCHDDACQNRFCERFPTGREKSVLHSLVD